MKVDAFTRLELLVCIATTGLLSAAGLSLTADTRERSERIVCMNNLRQVGRAFHTWSSEHGGECSWWLPLSQGGTRTHPMANNAWFQFFWISEDLPSPATLVCPSDSAKRRATSFSTAPGGLGHPVMQNNALSYLLGLHAMRELPREWLSGDRNVMTSASSGGCSSGIAGFQSIIPSSAGGPGSSWTNALHVTSGSLLFNDGSVEQMTTRELNAYLNSFAADDGANAFHLLIP